MIGNLLGVKKQIVFGEKKLFEGQKALGPTSTPKIFPKRLRQELVYSDA